MRRDPGPRHFWKLLILGLCAGLTAAVAFGVWIVALRNRRWTELEVRVESLHRELDSPQLARLPLGRTLVAGNAWDDYLAANPNVPGKPPRIIAGKIIGWLRRDPKYSRTEVESLVSEFSPSIELIRKGTRREFAKTPPAMAVRYGVGGGDISALCIAKARLLAEGGEVSEAVDLLVDACLYSRDVAGMRSFGAASSGIHLMESAFRELKDMLERLEIPRADLNRLDLVLRLLDEHFPDAEDDLKADLLEFGSLLVREDLADQELAHFGNDVERPRRSWRYFFSSRLKAAAEFSYAEDIVRRALDLKGQPWSVVSPGNQALYQEVDQSKDPLISHGLNHLLGVQGAMTTRGLLRLLRVGVRYKAEGEILELADPVGGQLRSRLTEQKILFWRRSLYGAAVWEPKDGGRSYDESLTLELPRKRP